MPQTLRWRGISEQFAHDAAGNVLGNDAASRGAKIRGNLLKQKGDVRFEYDEFGNLTREVRSTKPLWVREFRYDCQHRLVEFIEQRQSAGRSRGQRYTPYLECAIGWQCLPMAVSR